MAKITLHKSSTLPLHVAWSKPADDAGVGAYTFSALEIAVKRVDENALETLWTDEIMYASAMETLQPLGTSKAKLFLTKWESYEYLVIRGTSGRNPTEYLEDNTMSLQFKLNYTTPTDEVGLLPLSLYEIDAHGNACNAIHKQRTRSYFDFRFELPTDKEPARVLKNKLLKSILIYIHISANPIL